MSIQQELVAFLLHSSDHCVITTRSRLDEVSTTLPPDTVVLAETPLFLKFVETKSAVKEESLVLLGRRPLQAAIEQRQHNPLPHSTLR